MHKDWEFAILTEKGEQLLVSFRPGKADRIGPVISAKTFAALKQITLSTTNGRGSLSHSWVLDRPRALRQPQKIFTRSGAYEILLGPAIGSYDGEVDACWVDYHDYPEPKGGGPTEPR